MGGEINLVFWICILSFLKTASGQCASSSVVGLDDTSRKDKKNYDGTTTNAVLILDKDYRFTCCGFISSWEIFARDGPLVDVTAQVWYDTGTGNTWELRGSNVLTPTNAKDENVIEISKGQRIRVYKDDQIGFYEPFGSMITYENTGGGSADFYVTNFGTAPTTFDVSGLTQDDDREHAIHATVVPSAIPIFTNNLPDTLTIFNTETVGTSIYQLTTNDTDDEDRDQLTVAQASASGIGATLFELDAITLAISIKAKLVPGSYDMTYSVTDPCGRQSTGVLTIVVDNNPPILDSLAVSNSVNISEDETTLTLLHTLLVTETDSYTCALDTTGVPFHITRVIGSTDYGIYLNAGANFDYGLQNAYVLELSCTDEFDASTAGTFTVNLIENEPPTIIGLPRAEDIQEDTTVETTLYTMAVTDPTNDVVTCSLRSILPATNILFLKPSSGFNEFDIVLQSNPNLQYDVQRTYRLNIDCADARTTVSNVFFMNVLRNRPPIFVNLQNITTLSSIGSAIGQIVFDVEVTDPENDQLTYTMTCRPSTNCPFKIYHSGEIILTRTIEGEFTAGYDLFVYVSDGKTTTGPRSLTIHILDINYVPVIRNLPLPSPLVVSENAATGLSIFQVSIQDNDGADTHFYSMTSDPADGSLYFEINSSTGLVTTSTSNNIDYETLTTTSFTFTITVSDSKDSASKNLTLSIVDVNEAPFFTKTTYVISSDEGVKGTVLPDPGYLYTDEDLGDTHTFSMTCGSNVGSFSIAAATGQISLATDVDVDAAGAPMSYTCTIKVSDSRLTDTASLTINLNNINDNSPRFSNNLYTFYVAYETAVNTVFGTVVATDGDKGAFGNFVYSLDQANLGEETFGIQTNGDLYLKNSLSSYSYGQSLRFNVLAVDTGGLQGTASVYVVIPQTTTAVPTTTTDRYITFWEYPANAAWVVVAVVLGIILCFLPCVMVYRNHGSCTYKGRPGDEKIVKNVENKKVDKQRTEPWKPWKWYTTYNEQTL